MGRGDCIGVCVAEVVVLGDCEATLLAPSEEADDAAEEVEEEPEDTPEDEEDDAPDVECAESGVGVRVGVVVGGGVARSTR